MRTYGRAFGLMLPTFGIGLAFACSPSNDGVKRLDPVSTGGGSGAGVGGSASGSAGQPPLIAGGTSGAGGSVSVGGSNTGGSAGTGIITCASSTEMGMPIPVDVYVMLDISGSMLDASGAPGGTTSKWDSVKAALGAFFSDPQSAGLSVAIQYFPLKVPGVPATCTTDAECGAGAPCFVNTCQQTPDDAFIQCTTLGDTAECSNVIRSDDGPCTAGACKLSGKACTGDPDCQTLATKPSLGKCVGLGVCENDPTYFCPDNNATTNPSGCGTALGKCIVPSSNFCVHETQCDPGIYAAPAVDFLTLPDTATALNTSINAQTPAGDTPSRPALMGAVRHAREHLAANVGHSAVVLLATDGLPTECTGGRAVSGTNPIALNDAVGVATEGFAPTDPAHSSVQTFVIGVFAESETDAQPNLDRIALAGGSEKAYVINAGGNVQQDFLTALSEIRAARLACEFQLPKPKPGQTLDTALVNVELTPDGMDPAQLFYVEPTGCTGAADEWHYDVVASPTKIVACPKTCDMLKMTKNAQIGVQLGCMHIVK